MAISWHCPCQGHRRALRIDARTTPDPIAARKIAIFWMVLCSSMLLVPSFWMIKFIDVLLERKIELMIVNSNGYENHASTLQGEAFVWKEWARRQFQCRGQGAINLDFLIEREGSMVMVWNRREKKLL
jgi:hypothetical protein